jgi:hypothetical protein
MSYPRWPFAGADGWLAAAAGRVVGEAAKSDAGALSGCVAAAEAGEVSTTAGEVSGVAGEVVNTLLISATAAG